VRRDRGGAAKRAQPHGAGSSGRLTDVLALDGWLASPVAFAVQVLLRRTLLANLKFSDALTPSDSSNSQVLLSGAFPGGRTALVRLLLGMDADGSVAMKVVSRAEDGALSEAVHTIIQES
jgi:hypothetical protein